MAGFFKADRAPFTHGCKLMQPDHSPPLLCPHLRHFELH